MAESKEAPNPRAARDEPAAPAENELVKPGETKTDAVSRLLQESMGAKAPDDTDGGDNLEELRTATDDDADSLGEIRTDDLGMEPAGDDGRDAEFVSALTELAEKAGVPIEDVYKLQVSFKGGDRSPVTLGELKDGFVEASELEEKRDAFEQHRTTFENEMIRTRGELTEVLKLLPEVPPEFIAEGKRRYEVNIDNEREALFSIRPEWRTDPHEYRAAREKMIATVADYGFRPAEFEDIIDHRLIKLLHDFANLKSRVADAQASKKKLVRDHRSPRSGTRTPARNTQQSSPDEQRELNVKGSLEDKVLAVHELLKGSQT